MTHRRLQEARVKLHVIIQAQHIFRVPTGAENPPLQIVNLLTAGRRSAADYDLDSGCLIITADELLQCWDSRIYRCTHRQSPDTHRHYRSACKYSAEEQLDSVYSVKHVFSCLHATRKLLYVDGTWHSLAMALQAAHGYLSLSRALQGNCPRCPRWSGIHMSVAGPFGLTHARCIWLHLLPKHFQLYTLLMLTVCGNNALSRSSISNAELCMSKMYTTNLMPTVYLRGAADLMLTV